MLAAIVVTARLWVHPAHRMVAGNPHDTDLYTWWLAWIAHEISGGHFSLITHAMNAPTGVNAMWNTSLLLPGVVLSPVTLVAGAQLSYNVLLVVGFAGSAYTAHRLLLRHTGAGWWPALAGGALYGFSPGMMHAAIGHVSLVVAPLLPVIVSATLDVCAGRVGPVLGGLRLGAWAAAQLLTGEELLYDTALVTGALLMWIVIVRPAAARRLRSIGLALSAATASAVALVGYPLWIQLHGPLTQHGSPLVPDYVKADLAEFVTPSQLMLLHTHASAASALATRPNPAEYVAYVGWPLLLFLPVALVLLWRDLAARLAVLTAATTMTFSLGEHLNVQGHQTRVPLPWLLAQHLPLAANVAVARFALFTPLAAAAVVSIALTRLRGHRLAAAFVAAAVMLPLLPIPFASADIATTSSAVVEATRQVPAGETVLVAPFPDLNFTDPMRWQADTGFRFEMPGGYFIGPAWNGRGVIGGDVARPTTTLLRQVADGTHGAGTTPAERQAVASDFAYWRVGAVLLGPGPGHNALAAALIGLLGPPTWRQDSTLLWLCASTGSRDKTCHSAS